MPPQTIKQALDKRGLLAHVVLPPLIDELLAALTSPIEVPTGNDVGGSVTLAAKKTLGFLALDLTPPPLPLDFKLVTNPAAHSFRFWLVLSSAAPARKVFEFAAGAAGVVLKAAVKKATANEELLELDPAGPPVSISGVAVALLIEGDPTHPATMRLTPTVGMPPGIVELQLVPPTVLIGGTGFGLEFPVTNGVPGAFVIDDTPDAATTVPTALGVPTRADDPAWRGLAARNVLFYLPPGAPLLGGHAVKAYVEVGTAPGEGIDLAISAHIPPVVGSRPGIDVIIECRDPAAQGLQDFIPTLVEASMELPLDGTTQSAPGGGFSILAGKPVIARLRFARSAGNAETTATFAVESQGPNGVLTVSAPEGGTSARILITAAALATAIVADKAPTGADTGGVVLHALLAAAVGLSSALKDQGRFTIHKVEVASTGHGLPAGDQLRFVIDYSVDVLVKPISVGVLSVQMRDEQPMRVRNRNVGLRLNLKGGPGVQMVELDFSRADMEIEDPGGWQVQSPASLFDILGTRSGRGSTWLEVDLRFKLNLGPVRVSGATIRATLNEDGTIDASLRGLDASLEVPGAIKGRGAVQLLESGGITAALDVKILPLNLSTDGVILYEPKNAAQVVEPAERPDTFWLFVQIGVDLPAAIPIANSGLGIYGISGAFGINARPKPPGPADPDPVGYQLRWDSSKPKDSFEFRADNLTFGAQAVVGTLPDLGFSFSTRAGLFITVPDVVVRGALWAKFLSPRMGVTDQPSPGDVGVSFMGVVVVDPADSVMVGLHGQLNIPVVLRVDIPVGARFPTTKADSDNWYIYLGTDGYRDAVPADGRGLGPIRAAVLPDLIDVGADAYTMLRGRGIQHWPRGGSITIADGLVIAFGFGLDYVIGVPGVAWAEVHMGADLLLATHPLTLAGFGAAGGSLNLGPFSIGVDATLSLLKVENADPFIHARLCGHIDLFFTDIEGCVELSINSEPKIAVPPPDAHPLDNVENGVVAGNLAFLIDHQFRRVENLSITEAGANEVWADTLLHLSFAAAPKLASGYVATDGTTPQFKDIEMYPVGLAAKPTGSEMLKYEWTLTGLALYDVTSGGTETLVKGPLSAAWQVGRDGDLGKRPQAGDLVLLTYQNDLFLNRLADSGAGLANDPIADAATACQREVTAEAGWAVGYVATGTAASFLLPADPVSPDPCVSRFTATLTEHTSLLPATLPLTVQTAAQIPPPFDYRAPALEVFTPQLPLERAFAGALDLSVMTAPEELGALRVQPFQSALIVPDVALTLVRLWLIVDVPVNQDLPIVVTDSNGHSWAMTDTREVSPGRTAVRFAPRTASWIASVDVRWPVGRRLAVVGLGGITEAAQAAAAKRNVAAQAAAAQQAAATAKQPQQANDDTGTGVQCVLKPGHTYRLDVSLSWEGWIYKQTEDGKVIEAGHLSNQTTYLPKGASEASPPSTARSYYFRTTPTKKKTSGVAQTEVALPQYGAQDYLQKWHVQRNDFRPEMLSRFLMAYTPAQAEDARFADDPVSAHFSSSHVITLAKAYGFTLKLGVRRVDVPGPAGKPVELNPLWTALAEPDLLTGVDERRMTYAITAPCPLPKPGATLTAVTPLATQAWYEVYALAKADDPDNVLDGQLDGVTFRTSRWRNPAAMLAGIGFAPVPEAATGDIALKQPLPALGAASIDGSDADFETAMDALGLDGWPAAANPRVSLLWILQEAAAGPSWLCAGLLVESPEPIDRPGRVELTALRLVMSPLPAGTFDIRRSDRLRSRLLWICSTPFAPRRWFQPRLFAPPLVKSPSIQLELTDKAGGALLTGAVHVPLAPSFAEEA
jgi:hypothetical protein